MVLLETRPCVAADSGGKALSLEEKRELNRQYTLFGRTAFDYLNGEPDAAKKAERFAVVSMLKQLACDIQKGEKTTEDFFTLQDTLMKNPANTFLEESYPGLNVAGWRVIMALIDPITYGTVIQGSSDVRGPISKRS